jgi:hypothetical protein
LVRNSLIILVTAWTEVRFSPKKISMFCCMDSGCHNHQWVFFARWSVWLLRVDKFLI